MVNKRGYLRVLEAILAVVLLFGAILITVSKPEKLDLEVPSNVMESQRIILENISLSESLRDCVFDYTIDPTDDGDSCNIRTGFVPPCESLRNIKVCDGVFNKRCEDDSDCVSPATCVATDFTMTEIDWLIYDSAPAGYEYECEICSKSLSCLSQARLDAMPFDKSVFTDTEFLIKDNEKRVVRLYFWR